MKGIAMVTRLIEFYPNTQTAQCELRQFANVQALKEWLARMNEYNLTVRVIK